MSRNKIPENEKKIKIGATINPNLNKKLDNYLKENNIYNKSQYIENLIIKDLSEKENK